MVPLRIAIAANSEVRITRGCSAVQVVGAIRRAAAALFQNPPAKLRESLLVLRLHHSIETFQRRIRLERQIAEPEFLDAERGKTSRR